MTNKKIGHKTSCYYYYILENCTQIYILMHVYLLWHLNRYHKGYCRDELYAKNRRGLGTCLKIIDRDYLKLDNPCIVYT